MQEALGLLFGIAGDVIDFISSYDLTMAYASAGVMLIGVSVVQKLIYRKSDE